MYGRKDEDDAPQEEAPSSSNGVRPLTPYTMDLNIAQTTWGTPCVVQVLCQLPA